MRLIERTGMQPFVGYRLLLAIALFWLFWQERPAGATLVRSRVAPARRSYNGIFSIAAIRAVRNAAPISLPDFPVVSAFTAAAAW